MKHTILHYIYVLLAGVTFFPATLQGIRISPQELSVRNDSLQIFLEMDLNDVHVNNLTSVSFTLVLQAVNKQATAMELPPVIISGSKRFRFERRERALASGEVATTPYLVLIDNHKTVSKNINYRISVPYASWMQQARLLLRQEVKDCCDLQLLGVDTLVHHIALKNQPVSVLDTGSQKNRPFPVPKRLLPIVPMRSCVKHGNLVTPKAWFSISITRSAKTISILISKITVTRSIRSTGCSLRSGRSILCRSGVSVSAGIVRPMAIMAIMSGWPKPGRVSSRFICAVCTVFPADWSKYRR